MSKYTVVVTDHFGFEELEFETREEVFNFVTVTDHPCAIFLDGEADNPAENEAWDDWLARKD